VLHLRYIIYLYVHVLNENPLLCEWRWLRVVARQRVKRVRVCSSIIRFVLRYRPTTIYHYQKCTPLGFVVHTHTHTHIYIYARPRSVVTMNIYTRRRLLQRLSRRRRAIVVGVSNTVAGRNGMKKNTRARARAHTRTRARPAFQYASDVRR
jgi:hypothetical protein